MDRLQHLFPAPHLFDDGVGIGGPGEGLGLIVGFPNEAIDGSLEIDDAFEYAALEPLSGQLGEEAFDRVEPRCRGRGEVEWNRGCRSSQARTLGWLCVA